MCDKCGIMRQSGMVSCCSPDGSWFGKCGFGKEDPFTWDEGVQICEGVETKKKFFVAYIEKHFFRCIYFSCIYMCQFFACLI